MGRPRWGRLRLEVDDKRGEFATLESKQHLMITVHAPINGSERCRVSSGVLRHQARQTLAGGAEVIVAGGFPTTRMLRCHLAMLGLGSCVVVVMSVTVSPCPDSLRKTGKMCARRKGSSSDDGRQDEAEVASKTGGMSSLVTGIWAAPSQWERGKRSLSGGPCFMISPNAVTFPSTVTHCAASPGQQDDQMSV
ncbi:hypothetical protein CSOJ01_00896 [Colletotrichum sojae]|uniref:Uncharacterized protein n=1 Tax=Colletotrichum sojae TaxID=2175907 RepID=A0A8H6JWW4_9PEZI|nr:hypothetical protein CSOJ01_00896 [Colletotrichum sojae]